MNVQKDIISKSEIKFTIEITAEEMKPLLVSAATHISEHTDIPGFRKGKASLEAVENHVGEMRLLEEAVDPAIRLYYMNAMQKEDIDIVGQPKIEVEKMAPGNSLVFTAVVALMPSIKKLGDYKKLSIEKQAVVVKDGEIKKSLEDLSRMQTKEVRDEKRIVGEKDLVVIDLTIKKDGVVVDGGQAQGFRVYMGQDQYVPGMTVELMGLKEGDEKKFDLKFPEEHYQKMLAGQMCEFNVVVKEVYELQTPEMNDEFAKSIGLKDMKDLQDKIADNLKAESEQNETIRQEKEMLELLAEKTKFDDIPDSMVDDETEKMVHELEHSVEKQGMKFEDYLQSIKKTRDEVKAGMRDGGLMRVKVALVLREVAKAEDLKVSDDELKAELAKQLEMYGNDEQSKERLSSEAYSDYLRYRMTNEKVIEFLRGVMVK